MRSYVKRVLQPEERIIITARLHWAIYLVPAALLLLGSIFVGIAAALGLHGESLVLPCAVAYSLAMVSFIRRWFIRWITELTVTNRRVVYGRSFVFRNTLEMNMDKVESVRVDQSVLVRLLGYGTIHVLGTGQSIEHLHQMSSPIEIRNAIAAS
ncbi:PH domain-containing protein [Bradyrhizobium sp. SZCCHNRI20481]|uniref:PH domain-containing protein n=1 Tax=Bradyrhizobium sp. SZCCHNRI20481 TaxID=3057286 RepID=UPI0029170D72|nr:PH domain-containing protein [Bradyrhizobium sp. SZCCHNRI20481]